LKALASLLIAGTACFALVWPAQSQLASHQVSAPSFTATKSTTAITKAKKQPAPPQVAMPAPPPIQYFPGFEEALVATGPVTDAENADLDAALKAFHDAPLKATGDSDFADYVKPLLAFIDAHPNSNWNATLYTNIGLGYAHAGYYSRTFTYMEKAWQAGRNATNPQAHLIVDRAVGQLANMHARVGHDKELRALFSDIGNRPIGGPATELLQGAREGLWTFKHDTGFAYLCGPKALANVLTVLKASHKQLKVANDARSGPHGFSLPELAKLAGKAGLKYKLIKREPGQAVPVPSIINWNIHHYAAITGKQGDRYIVQDPTFGNGASVMLLSAKAIDAEGSGYYLVPQSVIAAIPNNGWRTVAASSEEVKAVYGMGSASTCLGGQNMPNNTQCTACNGNLPTIVQGMGKNNGTPAFSAGSGPASMPMTVASSHAMMVSLHLVDTPIGYTPQVGKPSRMGIYYGQRESLQPATMAFSNLSPKWSHGFMAYMWDDPTQATGGYPTRFAAGGGGWAYPAGYNNEGSYGQYTPELPDYSFFQRYPESGAATKYVHVFPDGSQEVYNLFNTATTYPRTVFLTKIIDPQGNTTTINYDSSYRITSVVDAMGRSTTFSYGLVSYPLLITEITDPFGRTAQFTYDTSQRLSSITDPAGITSSFTYSATEPTFVNTLTTPYGTSTFNDTVNPNDPVETNQRSLVSTDPLGYSDYQYFYQSTAAIPDADPSSTVPGGLATYNAYLSYRNTFYWDKHAFTGNVTLNGSGVPTSQDFTKARVSHWVHYGNEAIAYDQAESTKAPLENRVWYNSQYQSEPYSNGLLNPIGARGRVLDDGTTQLDTVDVWLSPGYLSTHKDGVGRITKYNYNTNGIDPSSVQQNTSAGYATIASYGTYNSQHLPVSYTDAAGKTWNYTYTTLGQIKTVKDPLLNVTTYNYDTSNRLSTIVDANSVTVLTLTYDSADRVQTRTDSQGYALTYAYDDIDRVTSITYPDGTTDLYDYTFQSGPYAGTNSLELRKHTDRLGRVTTYAYDADQRLTSVTEPTSGSATRTTQYKYYENGTLEDIIDANGNDTHWNIDIQSRPTSKTYQYGTASATTETYAYENTTSRLHSITDALGQVKTFSYDHADEITGITYTSTVNPTPNVTFAYDTYWPRLTSMTDGTGTTSYVYTAVGTNGALKLATVTSPYTNGTIALTYDANGRLNGRNIPGGNETFGYDAINRLNSHTTPLGTFTLGYLGDTSQLTSQSVTNGSVTVSTGWSYDTNTNDRRLIGITNSGVTRSYTLGYGSGPVNPYDIQSITDTAAAGHPWASQGHSYTYDLIDRLLTGSATTPGNSTFAYDNLDNATTFNVPSSSTSPTYNGFNQINTWGALNYTYDANGNLTSGDGVKTYKYDAENRLIEIDYVGTSNKSVFTYDALNHRVSDAETVSGTTTTTYYLWCPNTLDQNDLTLIPDGLSQAIGSVLCQTRNSSQTVVRRDLPEGEYNASTSQKLIYIPDQLNSVRDVIDATAGTRVASYDFTPYGAVARSSVTNGTDYEYARLFAHPQSSLNLAIYRALDSNTGRWINRDPIKEKGGINLYDYTTARPVIRLDPRGLDAIAITNQNNTLSQSNPIFFSSSNSISINDFPSSMPLTSIPQQTTAPQNGDQSPSCPTSSANNNNSNQPVNIAQGANDNNPGGMNVSCSQGYQWCKALGGSFTACGIKMAQCNQGMSVIWGPGIVR
jgi:RHS repeat-associated protein